jgi:hypothetical protein
MRWMKVALAAIGVLIVFLVIGTVVHILMDVVFAAIVVGAIALAIKIASGRRKLPRSRRDSYSDREISEPRRTTTAAPPPPPPPAHAHIDVDDDLERLKREMGR